jgi:dienelactone hydrolase
MVTMRRRTLILGAAATVAGAGVVAACGTDSAGTGTPSATATAPILSSTTASSLAARDVTAPYTPLAGVAPAQAFAVGTKGYAGFHRGAARALPTTLWYPAIGAAPASGPDPAEGATPASGSFPLVLFSHGLTAQPGDYAAILSRWAQAGFVVAAPLYPHTHYQAPGFDENDIVNQPADASAVLDQLLAVNDPVRAAVDARRIAAAGHSGGGITTVGLFSAVRDDRLRAGVVMAGTDFQGVAFTGPAAAMLFLHGRKDTTVAWSAGHTVFEAVPWSRAMLSVTDGGHVIEAADFEAYTRTTTQFLRYALYGDAVARAGLPAAAATGGVATLEDQL